MPNPNLNDNQAKVTYDADIQKSQAVADNKGKSGIYQ
jgi:hypothetical protein